MRVLDLFAGLRGWSDPFRERGHDVRTLDLDPRFESDYVVDVLEWDPSELGDWRPDVVLASPPCEGFSVLTIGRNWTRPYPETRYPHLRAETEPKTATAVLALRIVERTREILAELAPAFFVVENPRAKLRKLPVVADLERRTVTYCTLGEPFMKPTDLFGGFPPSLVLPEPCDTRGAPLVEVDGRTYVVNRRTGSPCHLAAPRGSRTGIQGDGVLDADAIELARRRRRGNLTMHKRQHREVYGSSSSATVSAMRAKIPERLALLVLEAAERDLAATPEPPATLF